MDFILEIKNFVEDECKKPTSHYGYEPFHAHFLPVVQHTRQLAKRFDVDSELLEIAAWLHDIGSIIHGRENHHITGAKIAEEKLMELGYSQDKIELIKKCIYNHRGSTGHDRLSREEQIIAEADVMANFDNIGGIFKAAFVYEKLDQEEAKQSVKKKLQNKWNQLEFTESKEIIKPKYEAAMLLLG